MKNVNPIAATLALGFILAGVVYLHVSGHGSLVADVSLGVVAIGTALLPVVRQLGAQPEKKE